MDATKIAQEKDNSNPSSLESKNCFESENVSEKIEREKKREFAFYARPWLKTEL